MATSVYSCLFAALIRGLMMESLLIFAGGLLVGSFMTVFGQRVLPALHASRQSEHSQRENSERLPGFVDRQYSSGDSRNSALGVQVIESEDRSEFNLSVPPSYCLEHLDDSGSQIFLLEDSDSELRLADSAELVDSGSQVIELRDSSEFTDARLSEKAPQTASWFQRIFG